MPLRKHIAKGGLLHRVPMALRTKDVCLHALRSDAVEVNISDVPPSFWTKDNISLVLHYHIGTFKGISHLIREQLHARADTFLDKQIMQVGNEKRKQGGEDAE